MNVERREYFDPYYNQDVVEIRYRQDPSKEKATIGDRKAVRFLWNEGDEDEEGFVPQYQWSLWEYLSLGWGDNPFHMLASSRFHEVILTEEDAWNFVESRKKCY